MTTDPDRRALVEAARRLDAAGLMPAKSGNLSLRRPGGLLVTPAGLPYAVMGPDDLVEIDGAGRAAPGRRAPSSEWGLHAAALAARPEAGAVVHTHAPRATALSCARLALPPLHYAAALLGGDVRCAAYAPFGTPALAAAAVAALAGRRAALLANHGVVTLGATLDEAVALAFVVEELAGHYLALRAAGLAPVVLTGAELATEAAGFAARAAAAPGPPGAWG